MNVVRTKSSSFITLRKSSYSGLHSSPSQHKSSRQQPHWSTLPAPSFTSTPSLFLSTPTPSAVFSATTYSYSHSYPLPKHNPSSSSENSPQPSLSNRSSPQLSLTFYFPTSQKSSSDYSLLQIASPSLLYSSPTLSTSAIIASVTSTTSMPILFPTEVAITSQLPTPISSLAPPFSSVTTSTTTASGTESGLSYKDRILVGSVVGSSSLVVLILFVVASCCKNRSRQNNASTTLLPQQSTQSEENGSRDDDEDIQQQQWICDECENGICATAQPSLPPRTTSISRVRIKNNGHPTRVGREAKRSHGQSGNRVKSMRGCGRDTKGFKNGSSSSTLRTESPANDVVHGRVKISNHHRFLGQHESKNLKATCYQNSESQPLHPVAAMWGRSRSYVLHIVDSVGLYGSPRSKHDTTTIKSAIAMKCGVCNEISLNGKGQEKHPAANDEAKEPDEGWMTVRTNSPPKSSLSTSVIIPSLPLSRLPDLRSSSGSLLHDWAGSSNFNRDISQSSIQQNRNNRSGNAAQATKAMNTRNKDSLPTNQMCRVESLSSDSSSSIYIQLAFPQTTVHHLEQDYGQRYDRPNRQLGARNNNSIRRDNKNLVANNESSQQDPRQRVRQLRHQEKYWSSVNASEEIQYPAKVESSTIPDHFLNLTLAA